MDRFTDNLNNTVTDNLTGLMWTKNANLMLTRDPNWNATDVDALLHLFFRDTTRIGIVTWQLALDYVAKLNTEAYLNHKDWRLPTIEELEGLVDRSQHSPALPVGHPFIDVKSCYWTSCTCVSNTDDAWIIGMGRGFVSVNNKSGNHYYVWPVRKEEKNEGYWL